MQGKLVFLLEKTGVLKKKTLDHSYAQKAVHYQQKIVISLILGGVLSGRMVVEILMIQQIKDNTAPMLAIIMEDITLVNMEIIWG